MGRRVMLRAPDSRDGDIGEAQGLLGLDVQAELKLSLNPAAGRLDVSGCSQE